MSNKISETTENFKEAVCKAILDSFIKNLPLKEIIDKICKENNFLETPDLTTRSSLMTESVSTQSYRDVELQLAIAKEKINNLENIIQFVLNDESGDLDYIKHYINKNINK